VGQRYRPVPGSEVSDQGKTHYGWARLSVSLNFDKFTALLTGYAYETIANKPIIAGKTNGPEVITVAPASLGHLAQGASTISRRRTKEGEN
jgi:hypothetical protein